MYQPNKTLLASLFGYCFLIKILPFVLMHFGMDIQSDATYPWTFTPLFAVGLFGMGLFKDLRMGFLLPVAACLAADVTIGVLAGMQYGLQEGLAYALYPGQVLNYLGLFAAIGVGLIIRRVRNVGTVLVSAILAPVLFFLISNFGVWAFDTYIGYPRTLAGFQQAYFAGLPFLKNSLISTLAYSALLFSPMGIAQLKQNAVASRSNVSAVATHKG
ncbi:MAG TPA: DUF6580 family putative transport protein [Planctomicrobium sp.]|nr:DUF6580 family putative transport protein [Planctomicrobium sp.]